MREKQKATLDQLADTVRRRQDAAVRLEQDNVRLLRRAAALEILASAAAEVILTLSVATSGTCDPAVAAAAAAAAAAKAAATAAPAAPLALSDAERLGAAAASAAADAAITAAAVLRVPASAAAAAVSAGAEVAVAGVTPAGDVSPPGDKGSVEPSLVGPAAAGAGALDLQPAAAGGPGNPHQSHDKQPKQSQRPPGRQRKPQHRNGISNGQEQQQAQRRSSAQEEQQGNGSQDDGSNAAAASAPDKPSDGVAVPMEVDVGSDQGTGDAKQHQHQPSSPAVCSLTTPPLRPPVSAAPPHLLGLLRLPRVAGLSAAIKMLLDGGGSPLGSIAAAAQFVPPPGALQVLELALQPSNIAAAIHLQRESALELYTAFVMEALLLQTLLERDMSAAGLGEQLLAILKTNLGWICAGWVWNPDPVIGLASCNLLTRVEVPPPPSHWVECVRALQPTPQQLLYLAEVRRLVRSQQDALTRDWTAAAEDLTAAVTAGSLAGMTAALDAITATMSRWRVVSTVQAAAWVGGVTAFQMARMCVRAFPFAPTGDALLEHVLLASDAAALALARASRGTSACDV